MVEATHPHNINLQTTSRKLNKVFVAEDVVTMEKVLLFFPKSFSKTSVPKIEQNNSVLNLVGVQPHTREASGWQVK